MVTAFRTRFPNPSVPFANMSRTVRAHTCAPLIGAGHLISIRKWGAAGPAVGSVCSLESYPHLQRWTLNDSSLDELASVPSHFLLLWFGSLIFRMSQTTSVLLPSGQQLFTRVAYTSKEQAGVTVSSVNVVLLNIRFPDQNLLFSFWYSSQFYHW